MYEYRLGEVVVSVSKHIAIYNSLDHRHLDKHDLVPNMSMYLIVCLPTGYFLLRLKSPYCSDNPERSIHVIIILPRGANATYRPQGVEMGEDGSCSKCNE